MLAGSSQFQHVELPTPAMKPSIPRTADDDEFPFFFVEKEAGSKLDEMTPSIGPREAEQIQLHRQPVRCCAAQPDARAASRRIAGQGIARSRTSAACNRRKPLGGVQTPSMQMKEIANIKE
ncbi:hypothetical protein GHT06_007850 [Daphnia sinensis]|uniref:Uncharacterized protein n=1 Tax=Daphnia sinensis TaxID=1820382 RepID=A0AAD5L329_9CRUS|nr:hypothetical protein GHT06_007850 [Daphnia sinensis]